MDHLLYIHSEHTAKTVTVGAIVCCPVHYLTLPWLFYYYSIHMLNFLILHWIFNLSRLQYSYYFTYSIKSHLVILHKYSRITWQLAISPVLISKYALLMIIKFLFILLLLLLLSVQIYTYRCVAHGIISDIFGYGLFSA